MLLDALQELGAFGLGTIALGFKPLTTEFFAMVLIGISCVGGVVYISGKGILW